MHKNPTDSSEDGKLSYTNLKHVIWHVAFIKLLESITLYPKTGFAHICFDAVMWWLYPLILLLSADYEEHSHLDRCYIQTVPALCLIPSTKLSDLSTNALWGVENSNPHETLSFDPLHVNDIGNWGTHFFEELKTCVKALGREAEAKIDEQFNTFPRWHNLNHLKSVMKILFSDGNKLRDITKQMLYAAQNVLTHNEDTVGYALLQCIASYLQLTMHIYLTKNWKFPKVHALTHAFPDIRTKGAARNFSTRPNEKQHGPLKRAYLRQMNHKDVVNQVLKLDHISVVSELGELKDNDTLDDQPFLGHPHISAPQIPVTLAAVEEGNTSNHAFQDFRKKFTKFLNNFIVSNNIPLDGVTWLRPTANDKVVSFIYILLNVY
ncbi:hypothetical protein BDR06DRAFT_977542 [Suillus hirtellus]|nr:hypothetical protein BDR06DRAFT_977542 [Suillus hirtellus]